MGDRSIKVAADAGQIAATAAEVICVAAEAGISSRGSFSIALAGGSTPKTLYQLLASEPYAQGIDWKNWHIYFGDERCVPPAHPDSNYRMANESLLSRVAIPADNVHRMKGEIEPPSTPSTKSPTRPSSRSALVIFGEYCNEPAVLRRAR